MGKGRRKRRKPSGEPPAGSSAPPAQPPAPAAIPINATRLVRTVLISCVAAELLFVFLDATVNYAHGTDFGMIRRLCNIAREDGLASWFGTTQTFLVGLTLLMLYLVAKRDQRSRLVVVGWLVLTIFFLYMAADDGAQIHERMGSAFDKAYSPHSSFDRGALPQTWQERALDSFPSYAWQLVFMPFFGAMGIFMVYFLWRELRSTRARLLVFLALGLFSLGVVMDFVEGLEEEHPMNAYIWIEENTGFSTFAEEYFEQSAYDASRHFSKSFEEFFEMLATSILWFVFLTHFTRIAGDFRIGFTSIPGQVSDEP